MHFLLSFQLIITLSLMAQHSIYNEGGQFRTACGLPIIPFKTKLDGPGNANFQFQKKDIIDEAFEYFRVNVLFKNYQIKGNADKVLIYLTVLLTYLFKSVEQVKDQGTAKKRLSDAISIAIPGPKQKGNFLGGFLQDIPPERQIYSQYLKQLRAETTNRFLQKFFVDGVITEDFKFWAGLAKKKFLGLNYASLF